ncbi:parkin coregulated gene protein homolog [Scaptodrosophila lebanonensis]|uniref:Parkin coregulated gene protein homolog n=1 Tax=Drosophila lebanonensis TaxID=7225 RepID=A0A6J2TMX8_DROLE|nr:parkin coregulated gene protein homolog [Scaptodrosophila lebanonensis]
MCSKPQERATRRHDSGKVCRDLLYMRSKRARREVPAFTYQALQKNTVVAPPPKIDIFKRRPNKETVFKIYFSRGDIPVVLAGRSNKSDPTKERPLRWYCTPEDLDYCYYLPIFVDGLADADNDTRFLAFNAAIDMIMKAPQKVLPVLPKVILPLKRAFQTRDKRIIISALHVLQLMVRLGPCVGQALVPFYRQLLAVCNLYKNINVNLGAGIDPDRSKRIGDVIEDTLKLLEHCGGPNAFINIKYMIPTYESAVFPRCEVPPHEEPGDIQS